jgi:hypothetical protein
MGNQAPRVVRIALCHGKKHVNRSSVMIEKPHEFYFVDTNISTEPTVVESVTQAYRRLPLASVDELVFAFCPTFVFGDKSFSEWMRRVKIGGQLVIYGPAYDAKIITTTSIPTSTPTLTSTFTSTPTPTSTSKMPETMEMKTLLLQQMKQSKTKFEKEINTVQPRIVLRRVK